MPKFRKKPVVIEAVQLLATEQSVMAVMKLRGNDPKLRANTQDQERFTDYCEVIYKNGMTIKTLEGDMKASIGDYIIRGIKGEFYPCKPDIFEDTYESVD